VKALWSAGRAAALLACAGLHASTAAHAFDLQGHRGARGLAPENTRAAFVTALALGVTTIETDLGVTKDDLLVVSHDPYLNPDLVRGPDGRWLTQRGPALRTLTFEALQQFDIGRLDPRSRYAAGFPAQQPSDGERFVALSDLVALVKASGKRVRLNIETKITPEAGDETVDPLTFARLVVEAVHRSGMAADITVQSFDWRTLQEVKRRDRSIATSCLTSESPTFDTVLRASPRPSPWFGGLDIAAYGGSVPRLVAAAGCATWSMYWRDLTAVAVAEAHALKLLVLPWTVNDPAEMARLIDLGADGIITDYPDRLRAVLAARGMALPP
jgi:glycerophosphoryl diester phosphodiesterase